MSIRIEGLSAIDFSDVVDRRAARVPPTPPGAMLRDDFLEPLGLSQYRLSKDTGIPAQRIGAIIAGRRAVTADTDLRLCRYFGLSDGWFLRLQAAYDTRVAKEALKPALAQITPYRVTHPNKKSPHAAEGPHQRAVELRAEHD